MRIFSTKRKEKSRKILHRRRGSPVGLRGKGHKPSQQREDKGTGKKKDFGFEKTLGLNNTTRGEENYFNASQRGKERGVGGEKKRKGRNSLVQGRGEAGLKKDFLSLADGQGKRRLNASRYREKHTVLGMGNQKRAILKSKSSDTIMGRGETSTISGRKIDYGCGETV